MTDIRIHEGETITEECNPHSCTVFSGGGGGGGRGGDNNTTNESPLDLVLADMDYSLQAAMAAVIGDINIFQPVGRSVGRSVGRLVGRSKETCAQ